MSEPEEWGDGCKCWVTPEKSWFRYGSAVEPGSQIEQNPACPKHGDPATLASIERGLQQAADGDTIPLSEVLDELPPPGALVYWDVSKTQPGNIRIVGCELQHQHDGSEGPCWVFPS